MLLDVSLNNKCYFAEGEQLLIDDLDAEHGNYEPEQGKSITTYFRQS